MQPRRGGSRQVHVALLVALTVAFATGWIGYGIGAEAGSRATAVVHAAAGYVLLVLAPWKALTVRHAWRRHRRTLTGAVLLALAVGCLATGVAHTATGWAATNGLLLQVHVGTAVCLVVLVVAHVLRHPQRVRRVDASRRTALRALGVAGVAAAAYAATQTTAAALGLPGAPGRATGSTPVGSGDPRRMPVTQWLLDGVPVVDPSDWRLAVQWPGGGREVSYDELSATPATEVSVLLDCTGGWCAEQRWRGVTLADLVPSGVVGRSVSVVSVTGYSRRLPWRDATTLLLATHVGGAPLSAGHGAPVRLVAPGRRGFWWVKWVAGIEVSDVPWWFQPPLPHR